MPFSAYYKGVLILTDGCEHSERIEESFGKVPLVFRNSSLGDSIIVGGFSGSPRALRCYHFLGDPLHQLILKTGYLLRCEPRPILSIENVQIHCYFPYVLNSTLSRFSVYLERITRRSIKFLIDDWHFLCTFDYFN